MRRLGIFIGAALLACVMYAGPKITPVVLSLGTSTAATSTVSTLSGVIEDLEWYGVGAATCTCTVVSISASTVTTNTIYSGADVSSGAVQPYTAWTDNAGTALTWSLPVATGLASIATSTSVAVPKPLYLYGEDVTFTISGAATGGVFRFWIKTSD